MPRFRAFNSATYGDDLAELERGINRWLETDQPNIYQTAQSAFGVHLVISFVYEVMDAAETGTAAAASSVPDVFERTLEGTELNPEEPDETLLPQAELPY